MSTLADLFPVPYSLQLLSDILNKKRKIYSFFSYPFSIVLLLLLTFIDLFCWNI